MKNTGLQHPPWVTKIQLQVKETTENKAQLRLEGGRGGGPWAGEWVKADQDPHNQNLNTRASSSHFALNLKVILLILLSVLCASQLDFKRTFLFLSIKSLKVILLILVSVLCAS